MKKLIINFLLLLVSIMCKCQLVNKSVSLPDLIIEAQLHSLKSKEIVLLHKIAGNEYAGFRLAGRPSVVLSANAPVFNRDYFGVVQPDGTLQFRNRSQNNSDVNVSFVKPLLFSNTEISLNTYLNRFDNFDAKTKLYSGTPFYIQVNQPLFAYNQYKWDKKIEPLKYAEENRLLLQHKHEIAFSVCQLYFDLLEAQTAIELSAHNLSNAGINYTIEQKKFTLGASIENNLLQLEIMKLNTELALKKAHASFYIAEQTLKSFINDPDTTPIKLVLPEDNSTAVLSFSRMLSLARKNNPAFLAMQRKLLEARSNTDKQNTEGRQLNVLASYGLNNSSADLKNIYDNPNKQQRFIVGFNMPISDWGRRKNRRTIAKQQEELVEITNAQEEQQLTNDLLDLTNQFTVLQESMGNAKQIDSLTQRRFAVANQLFQVGKISITELQLSQAEKDNARRSYILSLRSFWETYYKLQTITSEL